MKRTLIVVMVAAAILVVAVIPAVNAQIAPDLFCTPSEARFIPIESGSDYESDAYVLEASCGGEIFHFRIRNGELLLTNSDSFTVREYDGLELIRARAYEYALFNYQRLVWSGKSQPLSIHSYGEDYRHEVLTIVVPNVDVQRIGTTSVYVAYRGQLELADGGAVLDAIVVEVPEQRPWYLPQRSVLKLMVVRMTGSIVFLDLPVSIY